MTDDKTKKDAAKAEEEKAVTLKGDSKKIAEMLEKMTVIELSELVKALEDKFGVSAAAPVAAIAAAPEGGEEEAEEEKTNFDVILAETGGNKIAVIKIVKAASGIGLKEAKELTESTPKTVKESLPKEDAEKLKAELEEAGAKAELK